MAEQWRLRFNEQLAFFGYRWLALLVATVAVALPASLDVARPGDAGLLVLVAILTLSATALANGYVRVLRQRPALLVLDLLICAVLLWLSHSRPLPFLPYALSALLLPSLLFGVRGALLSAAAFTALDLFGCALFNPSAIDSPLSLLVRVAIPLAFALAWALLGRVARPGSVAPGSGGLRSVEAGTRPLSRVERAWLAPGDSMGLDNLPRGEPSATPPAIGAPPAPLLLARSAPEPQAAPGRRVLYDLSASPDVPLITALEQLAAAGRQGGLEVRTNSLGNARPLNASQQTVLLRTAQEAMQNVRQHARAHTALITLSFEPRAVTLVVQDDGVGLLDGTYERPGLHALRAVRYRLAELDGQLAVFESESGGVTVRATLPME